MQTQTRQSSTLVLNRLSGRSSPNFGTPSTEDGVGRRADPGGGFAAGDATDGIAFWANASWSSLETSNRFETSGSNGVTAVVGAETQVNGDLLLGTAISGGFSAFDSKSADQQITEGSVGVIPYASYRIDDVFSVDGLVGYGYGFSDSERNAGTVTGEFNTHRAFTAANANAFLDFGGPGLLASVGIIYGLAWQEAYDESDGTNVGNLFLEFGSLRAAVEPSWLFEVDRDAGFFVEPFVRVEGNYDFALTDGDGASSNEDRLFMRPGVGVKLYYGDALSLNFDADTTAFLEKSRQTNLSATARWQF